MTTNVPSFVLSLVMDHQNAIVSILVVCGLTNQTTAAAFKVALHVAGKVRLVTAL